MFKLEIETDNAAFEDDLGGEVARILRDAADTVEYSLSPQPDKANYKVMDINGNTCGSWEYTN
jgi:hypothetical protein